MFRVFRFLYGAEEVTMFIKLPNKVEYIIGELLNHGYEAFAVGGCVRDALLGRVPMDWDITTSAKPEEVKKIFRRTIDTGIQHGTVTVMLDKEGFEVTTYRIDGEYEDSRHPKSVEFTTNLVEDLKRRDFTINAMAYNHKVGLVDEFGGIEDLERKRIVCVGDALERFSEDALRMLRAVRFSGQLGFSIEDKTKEGIIKLADTIQNISAERIRVELDKLICSKHPENILIAQETGLTKFILPELDRMLITPQNNPHHVDNVGIHCLKSIQILNNEIAQMDEFKDIFQDKKLHSILCWTMLLHDVGKPEARTTDENGVDHFYTHPQLGVKIAGNILKRLKFDNYTIDLAIHLIKWHDYRYELTERAVRRAMNKIGSENMEILFVVQYSDTLAHSNYQMEDKLAKLDGARKLCHTIIEKKECTSLKQLAVNGKDLIAEGFQPGKQLGELLNMLLELVLEHPEFNQKEILIKEARSYKN